MRNARTLPVWVTVTIDPVSRDDDPDVEVQTRGFMELPKTIRRMALRELRTRYREDYKDRWPWAETAEDLAKDRARRVASMRRRADQIRTAADRLENLS
jgi:hypothetical protein